MNEEFTNRFSVIYPPRAFLYLTLQKHRKIYWSVFFPFSKQREK